MIEFDVWYRLLGGNVTIDPIVTEKNRYAHQFMELFGVANSKPHSLTRIASSGTVGHLYILQLGCKKLHASAAIIKSSKPAIHAITAEISPVNSASRFRCCICRRNGKRYCTSKDGIGNEFERYPIHMLNGMPYSMEE